DPANWFHDSMHPNTKGHAAMAAAINAWIDAHEPLTTIAPTPADLPPPHPVPSLEQVMGDPNFVHCESKTHRPDDCYASVSDWATRQQRDLVLSLALPLLAIAAGAWAITLALLSRHSTRGS